MLLRSNSLSCVSSLASALEIIGFIRIYAIQEL